MLKRIIVPLLVITILISGFAPFSMMDAKASNSVMYGSTGANSIDPGSLVIVSTTDGSQTFIGDPTGVGPAEGNDLGFSGLTFTGDGRLWASQVEADISSGPSDLVELDPDTGDIIKNVGQISGGVKIQDLAAPPFSNQLFGWDKIGGGCLYKINRDNAAGTLVACPPNVNSNGAIGFGPDGTLYLVERGGDLLTLDPETGAVITQVARSPSGYELDALGVSNNPGVLFVAGTTNQGNGPEINTLDTDGTRTVVGSDTREISDLAFRPIEGVGGELLPIDTTALLLAGIQTSAIWLIPLVASVAGIGVVLIRKKISF